MDKGDIDFGARAKPAKDQPVPAVYMFQPAYYVVLENHELDQWQKTLEEKVGIKRDVSPGMMMGRGSYCLCGSTYFSEACDCDEV